MRGMIVTQPNDTNLHHFEARIVLTNDGKQAVSTSLARASLIALDALRALVVQP